MHRATQTRRHLQDQVDATRASLALNLATMDTRKACSPGGKDCTPNDMLKMSPGRAAPYSSTAYCSPCKGERAQMRHRAHPPRRLHCSELHLCLKYAKRIVVLPCWLLRADNRQSRYVQSEAHSDEPVRRRLLLLERTSPQVPIGIHVLLE